MPPDGNFTIGQDFAENHNIAADNRRQTDRNGRHLVRRGRQVQRLTGRLARHLASCRRAAADRASTHQLHLLSGHTGCAVQRRSQIDEPALQHHRRCGDPQRRRGGSAVVYGDVQGGIAFYVQNGSSITFTTTLAASSFMWSRTRLSRRGAINCVSSST